MRRTCGQMTVISASLMAEGRTRTGRQAGRPFRVQQRFDLLTDHGFATGDFLTTLFEIIVGDGLQIVNVVEVNVFQKIHFRLDVTWYRDVDQQQWPVLAKLHERLEFRAVQHVMRRGGAADDDVDSLKFTRPPLEMNGASAEVPAQG